MQAARSTLYIVIATHWAYGSHGNATPIDVLYVCIVPPLQDPLGQGSRPGAQQVSLLNIQRLSCLAAPGCGFASVAVCVHNFQATPLNQAQMGQATAGGLEVGTVPWGGQKVEKPALIGSYATNWYCEHTGILLLQLAPDPSDLLHHALSHVYEHHRQSQSVPVH